MTVEDDDLGVGFSIGSSAEGQASGSAHAAVYLQEFLEGAISGAPARIMRVLDDARIDLGLSASISRVLFVAMRVVGTWWRAAPYDTISERVATEASRAWLERVATSLPVPLNVPPTLLACGPGDRHTLGLEAFDVLLRQDLQPCRVLGVRTSPRAIATAVRASEAGALVIASHLSVHRLAATQLLKSAESLPVELFYAGDAFSTDQDRFAVPGTYLGTDMDVACRMVIDRGSGGRLSTTPHGSG